jgi:hypothetical protein
MAQMPAIELQAASAGISNALQGTEPQCVDPQLAAGINGIVIRN